VTTPAPVIRESSEFIAPPIDSNQCFLCRAALDAENRSAEHVIPKWLQDWLKLWNEELWLINSTPLRYRQATIPCCQNCNSQPLAALEKEIQTAFKAGVAGVRALPEERLFQWCGKIFYGLFVREFNLVADRKDPSAGTIVSKEFLTELATFHFFMQSIVRPIVFDGFRPYSIFVVETLTFNESCENFDYYDALFLNPSGGRRLSLCLAIRAGSVGVICAFQDNGAQKQELQSEIDKFEGIPLHPFQFIELACLSICKASLLSYVPRYSAVQSANGEGAVVHWHDPKVDFFWNDWDHESFAKLFSKFLSQAGFAIAHDQIYTPSGRVSFLFNGARPIRYDHNCQQID
jgi:hypothetical protein